MRTAILPISAVMFFMANPVHARAPELKPEAEEGGQRVINWEMGDAAFVGLQRLAEVGATGRWETVLSTTSSTSFTCPKGEEAKLSYRLANPLVWKTSVVDDDVIVGRFSSLAFKQDGKPCISYEGDSPKCLKYAEFDGSKWQISIVDNVMAGTTSLACGPEGNPAIAYLDRANWDLKFAIRSKGGWLISAVDHEGRVGEYASLAFSPAGNPGISYLDSTNGDLKYAELMENKWITTTLDSEGFVGEFTSLKFAHSGRPSISYRSEFHQSLKYAAYDGKKWDLTTVDNAGPTGWYSSLVFGKQDAPRIAYWSKREDSLKMAIADDLGWQTSTVDKGAAGRSASIAISKGGQVAIAYGDDTDVTAPKLKYAILVGVTWKNSFVDQDIGSGYQISLVFDPRGMPAISYYDVDKRRLKFAELVPLVSP